MRAQWLVGLSVAMFGVLLGAVLLGACAHGRVAGAADPGPQLRVESPAAEGVLVGSEVDVEGTVSTYDGRAWVHVQSIEAEVTGHRFIARRVPLPVGHVLLSIAAADGRGKKTSLTLPLFVESPERPRSATMCRTALGCLRYEERGVPQRDTAGLIRNAVVVVPPFGADERLDEIWPDLVGPGRALDPRERYLVGVAPAPDQAGRLPAPEAVVSLIGELLHDREIDRSVALVGLSSYGSELVLRSVVRGLTSGPILLCGGHDRPFDEPVLQELRETVRRMISKPAAEAWTAVARTLIPASYGAAYLADARHAAALGLSAERARPGLGNALVEEMAAHFAATLPIVELGRRIDAAFDLAAHPILYPALIGRRAVLVANRGDQLISISRIRALAVRLALSGATVSTHELVDPLGHDVFFLRDPLELETAIRLLFADPRPSPATTPQTEPTTAEPKR
jgi:hypothetical protein